MPVILVPMLQILLQMAIFNDGFGTLETQSATHYDYFTSSDDTDSGVLSDPTLGFTKDGDDSVLFINYYDNVRTNGSGKAYRWEVLLNGEACTSPATIRGNLYADSRNIHRIGTVSCYCEEKASGALAGGSINVSVQVGNASRYSVAHCYIGCNE